MVPCCEGKGLFLRGSPHATCPLPALLSRTKRRGPGSGCRAANREGLCASWQELGRARRCWVGAVRAPGQPRLRSWAGSAASTFLGLPGSGSVCGRRASARQLLTLPTAHPDGPTLPPGNLGPTVSPVMPQPPAASPRQDHPGGAVLPAQRCRPARVLSPGNCWTPWDTCPCTDSPSVPAPPEAPCMASPSALSFPKGSCSTQGAAHAQHFCSQGTSAGLGQEG